MEFKIGDRVKCINTRGHDSWFTKGKVYTIKRYNSSENPNIDNDTGDDTDILHGEFIKIGGSMSKYDEKTTQAIKDSTEHHEDNLHKLETLSGNFSVGVRFFRIGKETIDYNSTSCALCKASMLTEGGCPSCPLSKAGFNCTADDSIWKKIRDVATKEQAIKAEEEMVRVLKGLLEEEVEMFKKGDKVKVKEGFACSNCANRILTVIETGRRTGHYPIKVSGTDSSDKMELFEIEALEKVEVKVNKYDDLKNRIDKVTCWGKECDDILQEIQVNHSFDIQRDASTGCDRNTGIIKIHILRGYTPEETGFFRYGSQCEKLDAFKEALMFLLDHSDIKKTLVGSEVKADIEGKVYKVKVLSEDC